MDMYIPSIPGNLHVENVVKKFGPFTPEPLDLPPDCSFVFICFTNRCGSNYFAELLASSRHYRRAGETLNAEVILKVAAENKFESFNDYFRHLVDRACKSNCVIVKVGITQIELLGRAGILQQIRDRSSFILLERGDKLGQAISHSLAFGTRRFTSKMEGSKAPEEVAFSTRKLEKIIARISDTYREFDLFFARNGITPVSVTYEQLIDDAVTFATYAAKRSGLTKLVITPEKVKISRQANELNEQWRAQYLSSEKRTGASPARTPGKKKLQAGRKQA